MNKGNMNNNQRTNDSKMNNGASQNNASQLTNETSIGRFVLKKNGKEFVQNSAVNAGSNNPAKKSPDNSDLLSKIIPKSYIKIYVKGQDEIQS